jgi:hypothetical protein
MSAKESVLKTNDALGVGDYLVSNNGVFFAIQQGDGNFCVYRGSGPADNHGFLWGSVQAAGYPPANGNYFVIMQSDGNFCGYKGTGPAENQGFVWGSVQLGHYKPEGGQYNAVMQDDGNFCVYRQGSASALFCSMATDPVTDVEISSIEYDVAAAKTLHSGPAELYRQTVRNDSAIPQSSSISGSATVSETSGWSDSLAVKVGVSTSFKTGIPFIAEGKVTVSVDVTNTYTWNGSKTTAKTWGFNTPVVVPPHTTIVGLISATLSTIAVPYTLSGTFILKSGARIAGRINGIYTGSNSHDLTVTFVQLGAGASPIQSTTHAVKATLT